MYNTMDLEGIVVSKICQRETKLYDLTCMWNLKKQKTLRKRDQTCGYQNGLSRGRRNLRKVVKRYKLSVIR